MKHIPALLCCFALLFALAACGQKQTPTEAPKEDPTAQETPAEEETKPAEETQPTEEPKQEEEQLAEEQPAAPPETPQSQLGMSHVLAFSASPAEFDWDGDGKTDVFTFGRHTDDESIASLHIELSSGESFDSGDIYVMDRCTLRFVEAANYDAPILFLSGTDGTDYFLTYACKLENGVPTAVKFADPSDTQQADDNEDYVLGKVCDELDANGNLCMEQIIHLLGTRSALCSYTPDDSGALVRLDDSIWTLIGENAPLRTIRELPAYTLRERNAMPADGAPDMTLPAGIDITPTGVLLTKDGGILCFETPDGSFGALRAVRQDSWYIGSISEYDAFEVLPYAG